MNKNLPDNSEKLKQGLRRYTYTPEGGKTIDIWCYPNEIRNKIEALKKKEAKAKKEKS